MKYTLYSTIIIIFVALSGCDTTESDNKRIISPQVQLDALSRIATRAYQKRNYVTVLYAVKEATSISHQEYGPEDTRTLSNQSHLALINALRGHANEAEALYQREIEKNRRIFGKSHPKTLMSMNNLGLLYASRHRFTEADELLKRALRVNIQNDIHHFTSLNNQAYLLLQQGRIADYAHLYANTQQLLREVHDNNDAGIFVGEGEITWVAAIIDNDSDIGYPVDCSMFNSNVGPFNPDPDTGGLMAQCGPFGTMPTFGMWGGWGGNDSGGGGGNDGGSTPLPTGGGEDGGNDTGISNDLKNALPIGYEEDFNGCATGAGDNRSICCIETEGDCRIACTEKWFISDENKWLECRIACEEAGKQCQAGNTL